MRGDALAQPPEDRACRFHDKTLKGFQTFRSLVELHYPRAETNEDWLYYSQLNQRDALREAIEHFRTVDYCKGSLIWQLNDCYPAQSWSVLDFDQERKAAAFELERLYHPLVISLRVHDLTCEVWLVLDNATHAESGELQVEARRLHDGSTAASWSCWQVVAPGQRVCALQLDLSVLESEALLLTGSFSSVTASRLVGEPKSLPKSSPRFSLHWAQDEHLELVAQDPVLDLFIWDPTETISLSRNFLTLPSPGRTLIPTKGRRDDSCRLRARTLCCPGFVDVDLKASSDGQKR
jgi:beta-mannosidase